MKARQVTVLTSKQAARMLRKAARIAVETKANEQARALAQSGARRFAVGDPAIYECGNESARVEVGTLAHGGGNYARFANGSECPALSRNLFPAARFLISPQRMRAVGAIGTLWKAHAGEVIELLGLPDKAKLPAQGMPVKWIQGHAVYVISSQEAKACGLFHRVRMICEDCGAHIPAGRAHQHKCK